MFDSPLPWVPFNDPMCNMPYVSHQKTTRVDDQRGLYLTTPIRPPEIQKLPTCVATRRWLLPAGVDPERFRVKPMGCGTSLKMVFFSPMNVPLRNTHLQWYNWGDFFLSTSLIGILWASSWTLILRKLLKNLTGIWVVTFHQQICGQHSCFNGNGPRNQHESGNTDSRYNEAVFCFDAHLSWDTKKKNTFTFHYTGWLIGIPFMVYHNGYRTG